MIVILSKEEKQILEHINELFDRAETLFNKLSLDTQEAILNFHNENYSLNYCLRWGLQASNELLEEGK